MSDCQFALNVIGSKYIDHIKVYTSHPLFEITKCRAFKNGYIHIYTLPMQIKTKPRVNRKPVNRDFYLWYLTKELKMLHIILFPFIGFLRNKR